MHFISIEYSNCYVNKPPITSERALHPNSPWRHLSGNRLLFVPHSKDILLMCLWVKIPFPIHVLRVLFLLNPFILLNEMDIISVLDDFTTDIIIYNILTNLKK